MKALARCQPTKNRFKIIEDKDANGAAVYELWYHEPTFWNKDRWVAEKEYGYRHSWVRQFKSEADVYKFLRSRLKTRKVVHEGVLSDEI